MFFKRKTSDNEKNTLEQIDKSNIPAHIAIIMDGNGRWAKKRGLPRSIGHKAGVETIRDIVKASSSLGIKYLTLYAFSTENWNRPNDEVSILMKLLLEYLKNEIKELHMNNVIVRTIGDTTHLPKECIEELNNAYELTKTNKGLTLNLALNYGGRDEIKRAIVDIANEVKLGKIKVEDIDEVLISNKLDTSYMPDPDLIIRPSGEYRVSNFLLWQLAYSEFWYSNIYWPDFKREHLYNAIIDYQKRNRRFGGVQQG